ncbi:F0F1 ATP synthase subunit delta [bacterium]|nr:F0F1 ATP synthase subunit delta [bacterium]
MIVGSVARRYARAIFAVAEEQTATDQIGNELQLLGAVADDPQIAAALANPLLSASARRDLATTIADNLKLGATTRNFISLLADHRRLDQLVGIAREFTQILDRKLQRVRATITSATPLDDAQRQSLIAAFERKLGRTVLAETAVDPQLLGGVVVDVEGTVYDGSVRTQLQSLANRIAGGRSLL